MLSHFPPIDLYDDIADPRDRDLLSAAVQRTNPRMADTYGKLSPVPVERLLSGAGASWVMAPFVHFSPDRPSRFSDGSYCAYYAGDTLETALRERRCASIPGTWRGSMQPLLRGRAGCLRCES